ncbi:hypothetical protein PAXINDRAFT_13634 [Paxillus involutus ATCC 200175]|uniref:Unplaced genomic scaffold PAXINscaffold_29, whole genome shotgun sequence n=1 Tax=Paxillus involutus ATCC 200175 TaxID=664439 RepID=A0A0C9U2A1_PAXIN|nr:hypothetical protein PAXINDRAFT_13634 [Paxillus involutus ATCC 200175]
MFAPFPIQVNPRSFTSSAEPGAVTTSYRNAEARDYAASQTPTGSPSEHCSKTSFSTISTSTSIAIAPSPNNRMYRAADRGRHVTLSFVCFQLMYDSSDQNEGRVFCDRSLESPLNATSSSLPPHSSEDFSHSSRRSSSDDEDAGSGGRHHRKKRK